MKNNCLASEGFGRQGMNYFIDFKRASNQTDYIQITRSDRQHDGSYLRNSVRIFEENFEFLFEAFSMVIADVYHQRSGGEYIPVSKIPVRGIKSWEPELRPREKLMARGRDAMSDAELLAMLLGSGTTKQTAVDLAEEVLESVDQDLSKLAEMPIEKLCKFAGIGHAKALTIISAMELGNRRLICNRVPAEDNR